MKSENLLIIFTRNPVLGKVKTRLAKSIGNQKALAIYHFLLQKTKEVTLKLDCDKQVFYSDEINTEDIWEPPFIKAEQMGNDLGERMKNAFSRGFASGYQKIIIIGSDLYDLTTRHIDEAFEQLNTNDVVIGPAEDGGYYLLGLKKMHDGIFQNKSWGTSTVRKDTLKDLEKVEVHLLEELNDIDVVEDIQNHPAFTHFLTDL